MWRDIQMMLSTITKLKKLHKSLWSLKTQVRIFSGWKWSEYKYNILQQYTRSNSIFFIANGILIWFETKLTLQIKYYLDCLANCVLICCVAHMNFRFGSRLPPLTNFHSLFSAEELSINKYFNPIKLVWNNFIRNSSSRKSRFHSHICLPTLSYGLLKNSVLVFSLIF